MERRPERCPLADEATDLGFAIYELLFGKKHNVYRILFQIEGQTVQILRIRHAARDALSSEDFLVS